VELYLHFSNASWRIEGQLRLYINAPFTYVDWHCFSFGSWLRAVGIASKGGSMLVDCCAVHCKGRRWKAVLQPRD